MKCGNCGEEVSLLMIRVRVQLVLNLDLDLYTCESMQLSGLCPTCVSESSAICAEGEVVRY